MSAPICLPCPVLALVVASKSGGLFLVRDRCVDATTPEHPAAAHELDEEELVGALLLFSVWPPAALPVRAHATDMVLTGSSGESLRPKLETWDPDIVDQVAWLS